MKKTFDRKFGVDFLSETPTSPGVYLFRDAAEDLVYVGKAANLRARLRQYRNARRLKAHRKMCQIVRESVSLEVELSDSETDALLRENELIREHRPRLNIDGAFTFLYPSIGILRSSHHFHIVLSTQADTLRDRGFRLIGCYRNRGAVRDGFDALTELLARVGHQERGAPEVIPYTTWRRYRQLPDEIDPLVVGFLNGESNALLEYLILAMVERASARRDASEIQREIRRLKSFFKHEAGRLATLRAASGEDYIRADDRDRVGIEVARG